jgi:ACS family hexuronate transporter-like MFS transporter
MPASTQPVNPGKTTATPISTGAQTGEATTSFRWVICLLLFWVTTANYIDRSVFSNLAPELQEKIGWTQGQYWYMTVAFNAAYAVSLLLAGRMIDVLGLRLGFTLACAFWGLAAMSHSLASTVFGFFVVRILLGLGEGGNFPAAIKTTAEWFPKRERALATGLFNCGSNVGGILVPFGLPFIVAQCATITIGGQTLGWRGAFLVTGIFDLAWIGAWLLIYKRPQDHPRVSKTELALINSDPPEPTVKVPWRRLFPHRQAWAFAVCKGMTDCFWWFYLVGAPYFFADKFGLALKSRGLPVASIYIFASVGSIGGGWLAGRFMKMGWTTNRARKTTLLIAAVLVMPVVISTILPTRFNTDERFFDRLKTTTYTTERIVTVDGKPRKEEQTQTASAEIQSQLLPLKGKSFDSAFYFVQAVNGEVGAPAVAPFAATLRQSLTPGFVLTTNAFEQLKSTLPAEMQKALPSLCGKPFASANDFVTAAARAVGAVQTKPMGSLFVDCARANNIYWVAVMLIALAAAAHQAWSANAFSLASDMFPRRVIGSVTGFGGFAGSVGAIALFIIVGKLRDAAVERGNPGDYFLIFLAASLSYIVALLIVHLLAPKLEPAKIDEPTKA